MFNHGTTNVQFLRTVRALSLSLSLSVSLNCARLPRDSY
jgi:hypothetical protein